MRFILEICIVLLKWFSQVVVGSLIYRLIKTNNYFKSLELIGTRKNTINIQYDYVDKLIVHIYLPPCPLSFTNVDYNGSLTSLHLNPYVWTQVQSNSQFLILLISIKIPKKEDKEWGGVFCIFPFRF